MSQGYNYQPEYEQAPMKGDPPQAYPSAPPPNQGQGGYPYNGQAQGNPIGYGPGGPYGPGPHHHHHYGNHHHGHHHHDHHQDRHHHNRRGGWRSRFSRPGRGWRYSSGGSGHVSCAGCCFIVTVIAALILGITGGVFIAGAREDTRGQRIDAYNDYLLGWPDYVRNQKLGNPIDVVVETMVSCNNNPGGRVNFSVPLTDAITDQFTDKKVIKDGAKGLTPQYKYTTSLNFKNIQPTSCSINTKVFSNGRQTLAFSHPFANTMSYTCRWKTKNDQDRAYRDCKRRCENSFHGTFSSETCTYHQSLTEICVKVKPEHYTTKPLDGLEVDVNRPPVPDAAASYGCFYDKTMGKFLVGKFRDGNTNFGDVNLKTTVRYSEDPWLGYMRVTEGTGDFGYSAATKFGIGIGCLVPSVLLFAMAGGIWKKNSVS